MKLVKLGRFFLGLAGDVLRELIVGILAGKRKQRIDEQELERMIARLTPSRQQVVMILPSVYDRARASEAFEVSPTGEIIIHTPSLQNMGATNHKAKQWHMDDVPALVDRIYDQILERYADPSGLLFYGSFLHQGERTVREIIKEVGLSPEYRERFIAGRPTGEAVELCYEHFLGRRTDPAGSVTYEKVANTQGFDVVIKDLVESEEYSRRFGEDFVPTKVFRKRWDMHDVPPLIDRIYDQVLERNADSIGLILYGSLLHRGEKSVREIIKQVGLSPEYRERFIAGRPTGEAVELCYEHFLGRKANNGEKVSYERVANTQGFAAVISALIESNEYKTRFDEDSIPPKLILN